ncbi:DNA polymerase epsilon catalytic subunit NDAI_0F04140 [Naumovozyma dairenensis CBS 421]|uniref:DNA polymerase epsilon catalytic subunit n=1 Tax=Naumovozyma dairenensis (strain ATCC 10597 / BCRC 20456 / CBS 421 / NBRC 0211 / NRRL Y-12639) TaxID=1071378 RepID=G0WD71_NAUDC|nr:hypothetical protein NDAI_0F04140 [Naumovozyma dairenensis CBS 421]CCD25732.1 hypothetical protein NDAI_0F04140 [Naumovozyma dairenensis CBS 421]
MFGKSKNKGSSTARFVKNNSRFSNNNSNTASLSNNFALTAQQLMQASKIDDIDTLMGFERYTPPQFNGKVDLKNWKNIPGRVGWLINMHPTMLSQDHATNNNNNNNNNNGNSNSNSNSNSKSKHNTGMAELSGSNGIAGVDYYFLDEEGGSFKTSINYDPYFFVSCTDDSMVNDVEEFLKKYLESCLKGIHILQKDDLAMDNHLIWLKKTLIKLEFVNSNQLFEARKLLRPILADNKKNKLQRNIYNNNNAVSSNNNNNDTIVDAKQFIEDIREYDVPYHVRVSIDKDIRIGKWYKVTAGGFIENTEKVAFADPVVLAFDIETTKAPLKFPDSAVDQVMMISYMIDGEGFLITNREIISEDIEDFEYTPRPEYEGQFTIFNEDDEKALLERFFEHIREVRPTVISTFNGDFFDWPFVETRAKIHGLDMFDEIGFAPDSEGEYKSSYCSHMDCFRWVKRDSYLPQGSQGLKAVTQAKLGYNPIELDPELMTPYAYEKPQHLSEYSVSDAVSTYYLYMKYVHPFIFSLCTILPLNPDEVLRKGTGTLCEMLLMVQAYKGGILLPNKHTDPIERFYDGHLLESETYVGGHVESLEAGVFRSDLKNEFKIDPTAIDELIEDLPHALKFAIETENKADMNEVTNFDEIKTKITEKLLDLKENTKRNELPLIYHVDVASMYPNIMTTNRLQPDSIKTERDCASCDFNRPGKTCARKLKWAWRGEFFPAKMDEYNMIKRALQNETFPNKNKYSKKPYLTFDELSYSDQVAHIKKRLTEYSKKNYHRTKVSEIVEREAIVCQRENPFYVDTVRGFRDRRYEFKGLSKKMERENSLKSIHLINMVKMKQKMIVLYDSLQLAHKVILNSFYGYVMRKGSRWYSMEMAGITCLTGATIIQMARSLVERVGRPLELDTDGIWCILPSSFPENYFFTLQNGKKLFMSYPCSMLNYRVHQQFTNHQYQTLVDPVKHRYETHSENSIFFEVDGPYKAMILPTSKEEGKGIKKRYAVFNEDGTLAELKGFELKRRGELQLIKNFQSDIFKVFLDGNSLESCYAAVASVANRWLDVLDTKGAMVEDEDLIALICENKSMSKSLKEYEGQKSTSITTAKRLGEFLGEDMVKDKGLQCKYIISTKPFNAPVTERAIPVAIFSTDINIKRSFLRRWTMDRALDDFDIRTIIDWDYYRERLASTIQKIITIPAALQSVSNPVPRVEHPDWLKKKIAIKEDKFKQTSLSRFLSKTTDTPKAGKIKDIEDLFKNSDDENEGGHIKIARSTSKHKNGKRRRDQKEAAVEVLVLPSEKPSIDVDYEKWLEYQKIKWKIQNRDRNRRTQLFGNTNSSSERGAFGNIIRKQAETYANSTWEILQYNKSNEPGILDVFTLINGRIQNIKVKIPKTIYIKFKNDIIPTHKIKHFSIEKSNSSLPNIPQLVQSTNGTLYKLTVPEGTYLEELEDSSSILNDENVLGIFESNIPSNQRAIIELGSSVAFKSSVLGALGKGLQSGFDMKNLSMTDNEKYLHRSRLDVSYLLHFPTNIGYEFFTLFKSWGNTINVLVLKPSNQAQELNQSILEQTYRESYHKRSNKIKKFTHLVDVKEDVEFNFEYFTDISKLYRKISINMNKLKEEKGQQFLLLLQSPYSKKMMKSIQFLNQVPVVKLALNELNLPQLNWQNGLIKKLVSHLLSCGSWVSHLIELAKYSNIPIGNLNLDTMNFIIDVLYARKLKQEGIIMWWNENVPLPDHGGTEKEFDLNTSWLMNDSSYIEMNNPNVYDNAVLEIEISNLTVNTVLGSALINDAEGSDLADINVLDGNTNNGGSSAFVEDSFSGAALTVLRNMLKEWWDLALQDNSVADILVNSFVGWTQNPTCKLFDGSLRYHIQNLTKKSLLQLINEFNTLGSNVVFADRNKLLIKTTKFSPENCYAYSQYMIKSIRTNPMFGYLDLKITRYWDILLWMNQYNFSGIACSEIEEKEKQDFSAYSHWQIRNFLPSIFQSEFDDWMMIILDSMVKTKEAYLEKFAGNTQRFTQIIPMKARNGNANDSSEETCSISQFTELFRGPLIKRITKLFKNQQEFILDTQYASDYAFPVLPGSHLNLKNPLLELVKSLSHVMLLSKKTTLEVRELRKEVLKIFDIREFAKISEFKDPSTSLVIDGFLCEYCSYISDLDFCKADSETLFNCKNCHREFNKLLLQEHLIEKFYSTIETYVTQDLSCSRCHKIKQDYMSMHCDCSGSWEGVISPEKVTKEVQIFKQVAEYFEFDMVMNALSQFYY